jgi:hypothetical protein
MSGDLLRHRTNSSVIVVALWPIAGQSNPLGVLHIIAFMSLCEAYVGIDPNLTCGTISFVSDVRKTQTQS